MTQDKKEFLRIEPLTRMAIEIDDADAVIDFWHHFELEVPEYLQKAADDFLKSPNLTTQNIFRVALCKAISEGKEPIFKDEVFLAIKKNTDKVVFHAEFSQELEKIIEENN